MPTMLTMQDALLGSPSTGPGAAARSCSPMNTEVGAGTMNPATFLRVLGPEPWSVGYVEPSVRPDDAATATTPTGSRCHTQYQVILKPEPGDPQELYLEPRGPRHRPARPRHPLRRGQLGVAGPRRLGAGLGGLARRPGDHPVHLLPAGRRASSLDPVAVEITYGMERILMALQGVDHFKDIPYAARHHLRRAVRPGRVRDEPLLPRRRRRRDLLRRCSTPTRPRRGA